ncbi:MAG: flavodoxin family protein [Victivallales bacterium]|jgi:multimeric flavodoxin WrbA
MKHELVIIQGSPRKNGNTAFICEHVKNKLSALFQITPVNLYEYKIKHCTGCRACMKGQPCPMKDDFPCLWNKLLQADAIIQAVPVYWYGPPGMMKDFIDRTHASYLAGKPLAGKQAGIITVATAEGFECTERILSCWIKQYGAVIAGKLRIKACEADEVKNNPAIIAQIDTFCSNLNQINKIRD